MSKGIQRYVPSCVLCQWIKASAPSPVGHLNPLDAPSRRCVSVSPDFITPLPLTPRGRNRIDVVVDRLFTIICLATVKPQSPAPIMAQLDHNLVYGHHGLPAGDVRYRDRFFFPNFCRSLTEILKVKINASAYHSQTDRPTELMNKND